MPIMSSPVRFKYNWGEDWQIYATVTESGLQPLAEYDGEYITNAITMSHTLHRNGTEAITVFISGIGVGVDWYWREDAVVSFAKVPERQYHDIDGALRAEGINPGTDEYQSVIDNVQAMVDAARTAAGLPVKS